jgi:FKBP-type peptidyl-prolyl cis-trans isomerase SlyD
MSMTVKDNLVVSIQYKITDDKGNLLDKTEDGESMSYIHGTDSLVPGLEKALKGKKIGDSLKVRVKSKDAFGEYISDLVEVVDRTDLADLEPIKEGMEFESEDEDGDLTVVEIKKIEDNKVTIDANHPFAGLNLNFEAEIMDIRKATKEELDHGHVHDGHQH